MGVSGNQGTTVDPTDGAMARGRVEFTVHGGLVSVLTDSPDLADWTRERLPPEASLLSDADWAGPVDREPDLSYAVEREPVDCCSGRFRWTLVGEDGPVLATEDEDEFLASLERELHYAAAVAARERVFVHAGAVKVGDGAVLLPGRSRTGKTSLTAALLGDGAEYLSDEYAVIDEDGRVHPFARPLSIRDGSGDDDDGRIARRPGELGARVAPGPVPVSLVVATRYCPDTRWEPEEISPGEAVLELFANAVTARTRPELVLRALRRAVDRARAFRGARGETSQVVRWLNETLDTRGPQEA